MRWSPKAASLLWAGSTDQGSELGDSHADVFEGSGECLVGVDTGGVGDLPVDALVRQVVEFLVDGVADGHDQVVVL